MTENLLRNLFVEHEHLTPDPDAVRAGIAAGVRARRRRRQATVAVAALTAAAVTVPLLLLGGGPTRVGPASGDPALTQVRYADAVVPITLSWLPAGLPAPVAEVDSIGQPVYGNLLYGGIQTGRPFLSVSLQRPRRGGPPLPGTFSPPKTVVVQGRAGQLRQVKLIRAGGRTRPAWSVVLPWPDGQWLTVTTAGFPDSGQMALAVAHVVRVGATTVRVPFRVGLLPRGYQPVSQTSSGSSGEVDAMREPQQPEHRQDPITVNLVPPGPVGGRLVRVGATTVWLGTEEVPSDHPDPEQSRATVTLREPDGRRLIVKVPLSLRLTDEQLARIAASVTLR